MFCLIKPGTSDKLKIHLNPSGVQFRNVLSVEVIFITLIHILKVFPKSSLTLLGGRGQKQAGLVFQKYNFSQFPRDENFYS